MAAEIERDLDEAKEKSEVKFYSDRIQKSLEISGSRFTNSSIFLIVIVGSIGLYGLAVTTSFILENITTSFFNLYNRIITELQNYDDANSGMNRVAIVGPDWLRDYYWIPKYVFDKDVDYLLLGKPPNDVNYVLIADKVVTDILSSPEHKSSLLVQNLFRFSKPVGKYDDQLVNLLPYPNSTLKDNREIVGDYGGPIELRASL